MDKYRVSLDISSTKHTLNEISAALGIEPASQCPEKGKPVPWPFSSLQRRFSRTCWRLESGSRSTASVERQLHRLVSRLPRHLDKVLKRLKVKPYITIGVFTDRPMKTVEVPPEILCCIASLSCKLRIIFYSTRDKNKMATTHRPVSGRSRR